ncbi:MAG TPA: hypothetical protein VKR53_08685 [Puia sp.]|nr:hypothetical protein [Puia sp.]
MIKKTELTSEAAVKYLRDQFYFSKPLSDLLGNIALEKGKIYALADDIFSNEALQNFEIGSAVDLSKAVYLEDGSYLTPIPDDARKAFIILIKDYLESSPLNCCIIEDPLREPDDPIVLKSKIRYVTVEDQLYYFLDGGSDPEEIENSVHAGEAYYSLCMLSSFDLGLHKEFAPFSSVSERLLEEIVNNLDSFFVGAYDHEGYLMWTSGTH